MRTRTRRFTALALATALALTGALGATSAGAEPAERAPTVGIEGNTITLGITPAMPLAGEVFQIRAAGNVNATQSSNVYLSVSIAPAAFDCYPTSDLEQARAEQQSRDPRWGHYGAAYVGGNSPDNIAYLEERVLGGHPAGAYRMCGYLRGQGQGPDPYVMQRLDFTIDGTCAEAATSLGAAQQAVGAATTAVTKAAKKVDRKKKAFKKAKKVFKKKKAVKAKQQAKKKMLRKKAQWKKSKKVLASRRAGLQVAQDELVLAQERHALFCP